MLDKTRASLGHSMWKIIQLFKSNVMNLSACDKHILENLNYHENNNSVLPIYDFRVSKNLADLIHKNPEY